MRGHRALKILMLMGTAATATAIFHSSDRAARTATIERDALAWARQIGTQAEGMVLEARARRERDPLGWAVHLLAQGFEPRVMRVQRFRSETMTGNEYFELDADEGRFRYFKILDPEQSSGVQLEIQTRRPAFLGAQTAWANDLGVALCFVLCLLVFAALHYFVRDLRGGGGASVAELEAELAAVRDSARAAQEKLARLRAGANDWLQRLRGLLTQSGGTIRDLVKEAEGLVKGSAQAYAQVGQLRSRVHEGIADARGSRAALQELQSTLDLAEVLALNAMLAAERSGFSSPASAEELHRQLRQVRRLSVTAMRGISEIERRLEPLSTDADLAYHALESVFGASGRMGGHISRTTEGLIAQAREVQEFRKRAAGESD